MLHWATICTPHVCLPAETLISTISNIRPELDVYYVGGSTYTADMQASASFVKYARTQSGPVATFWRPYSF
jgi:hypothetical protein